LENRPRNSGLHSLSRRQVIITFSGVLLAIFLSSLDQTIVSTAMPEILAQLGGFQHYTFVSTAYLVTSTTMIPITGKLTDIFGRKWFYTGGIIIFILGSILSGLSQNLNQLIIFRAFQGIGGGIMIASAFAVIGDLFTPAERGKYQGYISGVFGLSSVIGPTLGGLLQMLFLALIFLSMSDRHCGYHFVHFFFPDLRPERTNRRVDYRGSPCLCLLLFPVNGVILGWANPWISMPIITMLRFSWLRWLVSIWLKPRH
jgi:MFS family permease